MNYFYRNHLAYYLFKKETRPYIYFTEHNWRQTMKVIITSIAIALLTSACATMGTGNAQGQYEETLAQAEAAYSEVNKSGAAWRDTGDIIESAKKEAKQDNYDKALELVTTALNESQLAKQQDDKQKNAGPWLF